ncbi:hypothetical protein LBMAG42_08010 [Deltaproteobacteria bacterium]|nr:hypothetical protein LBMAG42_08010 [Deltaproteobacteria bacterium]
MLPALLLSASALAAPAHIARCADVLPALPAGMADLGKRVVRIESADGTGSGVVVSPDGFVVTAAHVVAGTSKVKVVFPDESRVEAEVLRVHGQADLALLRVPGVGLPCLKLAPSRQGPAADLYVVGSPGGKALTGSVTKGIVSGYRDREGWVILQTDASMNAGNSGGPVVNAAGEVAAIVSFKLAAVGVEGVGFAVAAEELGRALDVEIADTTDASIAALVGQGASSFVAPGPVITNPPAKPGKPPGGNVCSDVELSNDPFDGARSLHAQGADLFLIDWKPGSEPVLTVFLSIRNREVAWDAEAYRAGSLTLDLLLTDDTRIHLTSSGAKARFSGISPVLGAEFVINAAVAQAIAAAGPTLLRWTVLEGQPLDQDRSARQRERYYRPMFACLAREMAK